MKTKMLAPVVALALVGLMPGEAAAAYGRGGKCSSDGLYVSGVGSFYNSRGNVWLDRFALVWNAPKWRTVSTVRAYQGGRVTATLWSNYSETNGDGKHVVTSDRVIGKTGSRLVLRFYVKQHLFPDASCNGTVVVIP